MNIRPKTVRRLSILFAAFVLISGAITGWLLLSLRRENAHTAQLRAHAVAAYQAKDYAKAASLFSDYLSRNHNQDTDPEADFEYGQSRARSGGIYEAIGVFQHYLSLSPDDPHDARHELLKLYTQARYNKETRNLAEKLLAANAKDVDALRALIQSDVNDGNYTAALDACRKLNALRPDNLWWQCHELDLMDRAHIAAGEIVAHARSLHDQHPDDARLGVVLSVAEAQYGHDLASARSTLEAAAKLPPPDADSVIQMVTLLDRQTDFPLADDLLSRAIARQPGQPVLLRAIVQRAWERQRPADVITRLEKVDLQSASADPALVGYKALSLYQLSRPAEARPLVNALAARSDDVSQAWATALRARFAAAPLPVAEAVKKYREAIDRDPANTVFHWMLGEAYASEGATDLAVRQWTTAGTQSPAWAWPYCLISRTLSSVGRYAEALGAADTARQRAPESEAAETCYALAWFGMDYAQAPRGAGPGDKSLLGLVGEIQKVWKNEPTTLPIYVSLLCRQGRRDQASEVVSQALAAQPPCPAETLIRLAVACDQEHLRPGTEILDVAEKLHGPRADIALARAVSLAAQGHPQDALNSIQSAGRAQPNDVSWQLAKAQFCDQFGTPDAARVWTELGNAHPDDLRVQRAILASRARLNDRALWRSAIDRLQKITGPEDPVCRIEDTRWQLAGQPSAKDLQAIITSLQEVLHDSPAAPEAHKLLAEALLRTNLSDKLNRAVTELTAVHDLNPLDLDATARLAQLLKQQGLQQQAIALIDQIASRPNLSNDNRLWAAQMYDSLGKSDAAAKLLAADNAASSFDPAREGLLAAIDRRSGKADQAAEIYKRLLDAPGTTPDVLASAAEFFSLHNQAALSDRCLDRLAKMPLQSGTIDILRAHQLELRGNPQQAMQTLREAVKAHPESEQLWREIAGFYLRRGQLDMADHAAQSGLRSSPNSQVLASLRTQISRLRTIAAQDVGPLLQVISHDPQQPIASQAIQLMAEAKARKDSTDATLASLRRLSDEHPDFVPLAELLVQQYAQSGRLKDATDRALRATQIAPSDPEPLRLLCSVQAAAGNYDQARDTAQRWKQISADPLQPDLAIAAAYLQQPQPDPQAALKQLAPYESDAATQPARQEALPVYARALIMAGRGDEAAKVLRPLIEAQPAWRLTWMQLAAAHKDASAASAWLRQVVPSVPPDAAAEKLALAQAWEQIGSKFDSAEADESARDLLKPMIDAAKVQPEVWAQWAAVNQSLGNLPEAERAWRECLKLLPSESHAQNNLAYVLLLEGTPSGLSEAERLATAAIATEPDVSTFYDTLARIQLRLGKTDEAIKSFRTALDRSPANVEAMIGLADVLETQPAGRDEARSLLLRIEAASQGGPPLAPPLRKQLDRVKGALSSVAN